MIKMKSIGKLAFVNSNSFHHLFLNHLFSSANSIRVLCRIIEASMLAQVERYLKQAIVVKDPYVSSAAIVSGLHLVRVSPGK